LPSLSPFTLLLGKNGEVMEKNTSYSDEHLIGLARNGNAQAYASLFERYRLKIQQIIYFYTNDHSHVNDLSQEVLIKIYRHLHYFKEECQFSTWLYRVTQNTIKNYFRSVALRVDSEAQFADVYYADNYESPEGQLLNNEFNEQIQYAISRLSEELRICYGMHIFEGQTYEDIAKRLDCPIGTVRSRIYRARKLMADYVG
jgi:RNA polymerase sigma-70 factor, ECF subfamily